MIMHHITIIFIYHQHIFLNEILYRTFLEIVIISRKKIASQINTNLSKNSFHNNFCFISIIYLIKNKGIVERWFMNVIWHLFTLRLSSWTGGCVPKQCAAVTTTSGSHPIKVAPQKAKIRKPFSPIVLINVLNLGKIIEFVSRGKIPSKERMFYWT